MVIDNFLPITKTKRLNRSGLEVSGCYNLKNNNNKALSSCSTKWLFSPESGDINLHESLFFVVQNPFLNAEMDSAC
jgi:hypothetical protein